MGLSIIRSLLSPLPFRVNGAWYTVKTRVVGVNDIRIWVTVYFFYEDGTLFHNDLDFTDTLPAAIGSSIKEYYRSIENYAKNNGGAFKITGDTLKVQFFSSTQQTGFYDTSVSEDCFLIKNNSTTIDLLSNYCRWCRNQDSGYNKSGIIRFNPPIKYKFLPLDSKPDSTKMWFKEKSWYKK
jgi:hypothetical protein